jgi:hypothetical protein
VAGIFLGMIAFLWIVGVTLVALLVGAVACHSLKLFGARGRAASRWLCRAPGLDLAITYFTAAPMILGAIAGAVWIGDGFFAGLAGLIAAVVAQVATVMVWTVAHEIAHPKAARSPDRIVHAINRKVGRWRNHAAVWITALAVPIFWVIRLAEYVVYAPLPRLVRFPRYDDAEWVNVSRHKFEGLVGHDLIWCLYCDWMTGVWSLGSEMLRNVESFWCPIRFHSDKKCENCKIDFPDVEGSWIPASGEMREVTELLDRELVGDEFTWHGRRARLTVEGNPVGGDDDPGATR